MAMKYYLVRLTIPVQAEDDEQANAIAEGAAEHLLETFNDDESIGEPIRWHVLPNIEEPET